MLKLSTIRWQKRDILAGWYPCNILLSSTQIVLRGPILPVSGAGFRLAILTFCTAWVLGRHIPPFSYVFLYLQSWIINRSIKWNRKYGAFDKVQRWGGKTESGGGADEQHDQPHSLCLSAPHHLSTASCRSCAEPPCSGTFHGDQRQRCKYGGAPGVGNNGGGAVKAQERGGLTFSGWFGGKFQGARGMDWEGWQDREAVLVGTLKAKDCIK